MSTRVHLCLDDPEAHTLLCRCGVVYVLHGEALKKNHIVSCGCGVVMIEPNESLHTIEVSKGFFGGTEQKVVPMFHPCIKLMSSKFEAPSEGSTVEECCEFRQQECACTNHDPNSCVCPCHITCKPKEPEKVYKRQGFEEAPSEWQEMHKFFSNMQQKEREFLCTGIDGIWSSGYFIGWYR